MTPSHELITTTAQTIAPWVRKTPLLPLQLAELDHPVTLKLEVLQHSGSFKARGAFAHLLSQPISEAGVAAASGGNHGAAVAYAARTLNIPAHIFVPNIASPAKLARIMASGATVIQAGANYQEALSRCNEFVAATGAHDIHAYNSPLTIAGQASLGLELQEQAPELETILVAVGGGGLIAGLASAYHGRCKIIGVETQGCNALHAALKAGHPVSVTPSGLAADSLGASMIGDQTFPIAQSFTHHVELVSDAEVVAAQGYLWQHCQLITEPGGAAAFAALLSGRYQPRRHEKIAVILCGANIAPADFAKIIG